jgi:cardiolipin synthase
MPDDDAARRLMQLDALEFLAEQGGAPIEQLRRDGTGTGRTVPISSEGTGVRLQSREWSALIRHNLGAQLEPGHDIRRLRNGTEIFPAMLASIRAATHNIEFLSFIFSDGSVAERFSDALIERAKAGVHVRVLLDAVGGKALGNGLITRLKESGVELLVYHPISSWKFWRTTSRNHRKILVVDSRVAYIGGVGVADEWAGNGDRPGSFRDTHFRMTGPTVGQLRAAFFDNWASAGGHLPDPLDRVPVQNMQDRGIKASVIPSSTASKFSRAALMFQLLIRGACRSLQIVTPYFVPGSSLLQELDRAAKRGVEVRIMVSGKRSDHLLPLWAGRSCYTRLLDSGVSIEEFDLTLLHNKLVIVDECVTMFGSPNMNRRSQSLDEELAVICHDRQLARKLLEDIEADRRQCRQIDAKRWKQRSMALRAAEALASTFSPQI